MKLSLKKTCLSPSSKHYIEIKQALGRKFYSEYRILARLNSFLANIGATDLTWTEFEQWSQAQSHLTSTTRRGRMQVVRNYCLYRRRTEPCCFVPDVNSFPALSERVRPHIFSDAQITRLLEAASRLETGPRSPLRPEVFRLSIVLLYCTGMRRGELVRLKLADYDRQEKTLSENSMRILQREGCAAYPCWSIHRFFGIAMDIVVPIPGKVYGRAFMRFFEQPTCVRQMGAYLACMICGSLLPCEPCYAGIAAGLMSKARYPRYLDTWGICRSHRPNTIYP